MSRQLILICHNLRSAHNIGSLLRTADGLGINKVYLSGYSPHPSYHGDPRLPHLARKSSRAISKTALGAETTVPWQYIAEPLATLEGLSKAGYVICGLEQAPAAQPLPTFQSPDKLALIVGREVEGIESEILQYCDTVLEIPMLGKKESFNVAQAAAMALFHCRFS